MEFLDMEKLRDSLFVWLFCLFVNFQKWQVILVTSDKGWRIYPLSESPVEATTAIPRGHACLEPFLYHSHKRVEYLRPGWGRREGRKWKSAKNRQIRCSLLPTVRATAVTVICIHTDFVTRRRRGRKGESCNLIGTKSINNKILLFNPESITYF